MDNLDRKIFVLDEKIAGARTDFIHADNLYHAWLKEQRALRPEFNDVTEHDVDSLKLYEIEKWMQNWHSILAVILMGEGIMSYFLLDSALNGHGTSNASQAELVLGAAVMTILVACLKFSDNWVKRERLFKFAAWLVAVGAVFMILALICSRVYKPSGGHEADANDLGTMIRSIGFLIGSLGVIPGGTIIADLWFKNKYEAGKVFNEFVIRFRNKLVFLNGAKMQLESLKEAKHEVESEKGALSLQLDGLEIEEEVESKRIRESILAADEKAKEFEEERLDLEPKMIAELQIKTLEKYLDGLFQYHAVVSHTDANHRIMREMAKLEIDAIRNGVRVRPEQTQEERALSATVETDPMPDQTPGVNAGEVGSKTDMDALANKGKDSADGSSTDTRTVH